MTSIEDKILQHIEAFPKGELFLPSDFSELGSSEAVRLSLFRLEKEGVIYRVAQGIYVLPKESSFLGKLIPSAEEVAEAIAKRDAVRAEKLMLAHLDHIERSLSLDSSAGEVDLEAVFRD